VIGTDAKCERDVLCGGVLRFQALGEVRDPCVEVVDPGFDREAPGAKQVDGELGGPHVVDERREGNGLPLALRGVAIVQACGDVVVAIGEDSSRDGDVVADDALGGVTASVDGGLDLFDNDAAAAFGGFHAASNSGCESFVK
jgi:hypothetical protein